LWRKSHLGKLVSRYRIGPVNATTLAAGSYQLSILGTSGSTTNTLAIPFNVADFQFSGTQSLSIYAGTQQAAKLTISPSAFYVGSVNANCNASALAGATCTLSPANPISVNQSSAVPLSANIAVPSGAIPGLYNVTLTAVDTSGNPSHNLVIALTVPSGVAPSLQLTTIQGFPASVAAGAKTTAKVGVTTNYSASVKVTCDATAVSGQCSIAPSSPVAINARTLATLTLTLNVPNSAAPQPSNPYNINVTVTDESGQPTQTLALALTVIQDFDIGSLTPPTQTIVASQSASYNFNVLPIGAEFAGAVTLSCSVTPQLSPCSFTPSPVTPGGSAAAVVMSITGLRIRKPRRTVAAHRDLRGGWRYQGSCCWQTEDRTASASGCFLISVGCFSSRGCSPLVAEVEAMAAVAADSKARSPGLIPSQ
jgi:hypothetical protein